MFLALGFLVWAVGILWIFIAELSTWILLGVWGAHLLLWSVSSVAAFRAARGTDPPPEGKNPWKALFLTRFIPGWGHLYAGHWVRGITLMLVCGAVFVWPVSEPWNVRASIAYWVLHGLVLADAYFILRRQNPVPARAAAWALTLVLLWSQLWIVPVLMTFAAEVYRIPSSSMEPTLMGGVSGSHSLAACPFGALHRPPTGDRIVVSKLAYAFGPVNRFDVAVFRYPLNQSKSFVSRVVGLPGEEILIHAGDLFVRGESGFRIVRKPLEIQDRLWIRFHEAEDAVADGTTFRSLWKNPGGVAPLPEGGLTWSDTGKNIAWIDYQEPLGDGSEHPVHDLRVSFEATVPNRESQVLARLENQYGTIELTWSTEQGSALACRLRNKVLKSVPIAPPFPKNSPCRVDLMVVDGEAIARWESTVLARLSLVETLDDAKDAQGNTSGAALGIRGGGAIIRRVQISRDIHYRGRGEREHGWGERQPLKIPEGHYLFLGDNVANSHDGRAWVERTFVLKDGRKILCESQQVQGSYRLPPEMLQKVNPEDVLFYVDGDQQGNEVVILRSEFASEEESRPFRFVDRRFITGKVVKVWWPLERERPVR